MKKYLSIAALFLGIVCVHAQTAPPKPSPKPAQKPAATSTPAPQAGKTTAQQSDDPGYKFDQMTYDYGTLQKGGNPYCQFQLTNTGKTTLVIQEAHGSCGCTIPEYPKDPIQPGQTVTIKVHYDTNRIGPFEKTVTVTFQDKSTPAILHIHGTVQANPADSPFPAPGSTTPGSTSGVPVNQ